MCKAVKQKTNDELLSVAQEIAFAKALAANDKSLRDRALKKLRKWFCMKSRQESPGIRFTEEGFMRLWKGLFYCIWMSDKPLVQEEVVESVSNLIHCFSHLEDVQKFVSCFFQSISQSWLSLDGHRMDKYLMLIRRFLRQIFEYLYKTNWDDESVAALGKNLFNSFQTAPIGLNLHLAEIYLEELAKVGRGELKEETVLKVIKPFADFMAVTSDTRLLRYGQDFIFLNLIRQSDEGIKYGAKFEIWKEMGFPEGDIDVIQEASDDEVVADVEDDEMNDDVSEGDPSENALDPRAGSVDTFLPPIDFDAVSIRDYLNGLCKKKNTTTKARKSFGLIIKKLNKFLDGKYPLGIHKVEVPEYEDQEEIIEKSAEELVQEERAFALERNQHKMGKDIYFSNSWEVTPLRETNSGKITEGISSSGKWRIQNIEKRKIKSDMVASGALKKIKVTLDNSLLSCSTCEENNETKTPNPCISDSVKSVDSKSSATNPQEQKRKKRKRGNAKPKRDENENPHTDVDEATNKLEQVCKIFISEDPTKEEQNKKKLKGASSNDWGLSNEWETNQNQEEEIIIPFSPAKFNTSETPLQSKLSNIQSKKKTPTSAKKVEFVLNRNTAQEAHEYKISLKNSPSIPFDAAKKPAQGVLKTSTIGSPINPFYMETN